LARIFEDSGIQSDEACLQAYGQEDHCRLYGQDIFQRFESVGFRSLAVAHNELLSDQDSVRHGINIDESFFLFEKPF
jgi:hypothetical protein